MLGFHGQFIPGVNWDTRHGFSQHQTHLLLTGKPSAVQRQILKILAGGDSAALLPFQALNLPLGSALRESTLQVTLMATVANTPRAPLPNVRWGTGSAAWARCHFELPRFSGLVPNFPSLGTVYSCPSRDAKCGKIQCQGGASRPVIGTNAVSIETNIPLQEGGRILCRGTHVYLGDDMPDPGLVLAGTKCADGKVRPKCSLASSV